MTNSDLLSQPGMAVTALAVCLSALCAYLIGSVNFAILVSRIGFRDDIRNHGSGNAGMTNILRTYGKGPAAVTAVGDFLKGVAAVAVGRLIFWLFGITSFDCGYIAGMFVLLGHLFPVYFGFKGGKGVMVCLATALMCNPLAFLVICVVFIPFVFIIKTVSAASVLGAVSYPVVTLALQLVRGRPWVYDTVCSALLAAVILVMHRDNIKRLLAGTESSFRKPKD